MIMSGYYFRIVFLLLAAWLASGISVLAAGTGTIQMDAGRKLVTLTDGQGQLALRLNYNSRCVLDQVIVRGREVAAESGVASGIRMDLARRSPEYMKELVKHHVGGHLKVAPEHTDPEVLMKMRKPANDDFEKFTEVFDRESKRAGKEQYVVPYFIASHPASDLDAMIHLAVFLKQNGYKPDQVQDFIPAPFDVATAMYYTGIDPFTKKPVYIAKQL